ncbi:MAG: radical SAM protein [bacterium]|nr:radical SAM protein [bacterium]
MNILSKIKRYQHIIATNIRYPKKISNLSGIYYATLRKPVKHCFPPFSLDIEPTIRCNLRCSSCQSPYLKREQKDMSFSFFKGILDQFDTLLEIKITGMGEPLLNKNFFEMVNYAKEKNISVFSFSNGKVIDKNIAQEIINSGLREITISVDGATSKTHNSIRVGSDLEQVLGAIEMLVADRGKLKYPIISVWFVGRKSNIHEISELLDICKKINIDYLTCQHDLTFWGKEQWKEKIKNDALSKDIKFTEEIIKDAQKKAAYLGVRYINFQKNKFYNKFGKECYWPWRSCFIATDGRVVPCCLIADPEVVSLGDLSKMSFKEVWNNEKYQDFRRSIKEHNIPPSCSDCYEEN